MAIAYSFEVENDLLKATASGKDETLEEVMDYGMAIIHAAIVNKCQKVLCDETGLEYSLGTFESFESAKFISENAPDVAKVAIVCNPRFIGDAAFWETVAVNRGLQVKFFKNLRDAEEWLAK
jgi:hypothetical protein